MVRLYEIGEDVGGLNHPDGRAAILNATLIESHALQRYAAALKAFNEFVLDYKIPRGLPDE